MRYAIFYKTDVNEVNGSDGVYILDKRNTIENSIKDCKERAKKIQIYNFKKFQIFDGTILNPIAITGEITL